VKSVASQNKARQVKNKNKNRKKGVQGVKALGQIRQGNLRLKDEQFASFTPLETFSVSQGTTPGGIRVRGRELLQPAVSGLTTLLFGANNTLLAAGIALNPSTFPRLSAYNPIYEQFFFHNCLVMYQSNQPTTSSGVSMIAVDYDVNDFTGGPPSTTIALMRNITSSMSNVYANNGCEVKGSLCRLKRYYTVSPTANNIDVNQAIIEYAFEGVVPINTALGYIIVQYDVEFFVPQ
jgi:hypothetical protein